MNKKEKKLAISTALMSALGKMTVVEDLDAHFSIAKTKVYIGRANPIYVYTHTHTHEGFPHTSMCAPWHVSP